MFLVLSASSRRFKGNFITGNGKVGTGRFPQRDFSAVINDSPSVDEEDCSRSRPPCRLISRTKWRRGEGQWGDCCCSLQKDARFRRKKMSEQFWSRRKLGPPPLWLKIFSRGRWRFLCRSFFFLPSFHRQISSRKSRLTLSCTKDYEEGKTSWSSFPIFAEENQYILSLGR